MFVTPLQESFAAGEISPKLRGRRSLEGYRSGVREMTNFIADSRGPAVARDGFRFGERFPGNDARIYAPQVFTTTPRLYLLSDQLISVIGLFGSLPNVNYVSNPNFAQGGTDWNETTVGAGSSVVFNLGSCEITAGGAGGANRFAFISQEITGLTSGTFSLQVQSSADDSYRIRVGSAEDVGDYYEIVTQDLTHSAEFTIPATSCWITIAQDRDGGYLGPNTFTSVILSDDATGISFAAPWDEDELEDIHIVPSPDGNTVYFLHPFIEPQKIVYDPGTGTYTFQAVVFTSPPPGWTAGNWPGAGTIYQGRLWLGGTITQPQTFWGSVSGSFEDFTLGVQADDAIEFTISKFGAIQWMFGTKNLLVGTTQGEHIITSDGGLITPADIQADQQSSYGSARVQPEQVGDQVMYVSPDRTKLRAMQYEWSADNWLSRDLTFFSEQITQGKIRRLSWAQNPDNLLVTVLEDGNAAWLTYERGENVWGWHRHTTEGKFLDSESVQYQGVDLITKVTQRELDFFDIEITAPGTKYYFDSYVSKSQTPAFTTFDGLDHLEGKTVQVIADGAVHPERVVSGGQIELQAPAFSAQAGLKYTPKMVTLPLETGSQTGSSVPYTKNYAQIVIDLLDSQPPLVNGYRVPDRTPSTPMNTVETPRDGIIRQVELGWSDNAEIVIEQDLPVGCQVLLISGKNKIEVT